MIVNVPGLKNSNEDHWQTHWERKHPEKFIRIQQSNWESPEKESWVNALQEQTLNLSDENIIVVGHSVGCATIIHWLSEYKRKIKGALLVAPSDVDHPNYPEYIRGFAPMPLETIETPTIVIASSNDHVVSVERATFFAESWGSKLMLFDNLGHIDDKSQLSSWQEGFSILESLM